MNHTSKSPRILFFIDAAVSSHAVYLRLRSANPCRFCPIRYREIAKKKAESKEVETLKMNERRFKMA